jgi:RimJ/RimL family protein N-acetyltransferase
MERTQRAARGPAPDGPAMRIVTPQTVIRPMQESDAPMLHAAVQESLAHLRPWMPWAHQEPQRLADRVARLVRVYDAYTRREDFGVGIFDPSESRVLGGAGLHNRIGPEALEIGYWIHVDAVRQGLASEVASALTRVGFEVEGERWLESRCDPKNPASAGVARRAGFTHVETREGDTETHDGQPRDSMIWVLRAEDYPGSPAASLPIEAFAGDGHRLI